MRRPNRGQHKVVPWSRDRVLAVRDELPARYQLMAEALVSLIRADMAAGDLRQDLDADASVSLLLGSTWRSWFGAAASTTGSPNAAWS